MKRKHHFSDGEYRPCYADKRPCPLGIDDGEHFTGTAKEAREATSRSLDEDGDLFCSTTSTPSAVDGADSGSTSQPAHPLAKNPPETMTIMTAHRRTSLSTHAGSDPTQFDRHIEISGRYVVPLDNDGSHLDPKEWEMRKVTYQKPLHLEIGNYGTDSSWKVRLSEHYGGKKGKQLATAVRKEGYDAIVTSDKYGYGETVELV